MTTQAKRINLKNFRLLTPMADRRAIEVSPSIKARLDGLLVGYAEKIEAGVLPEIAIKDIEPAIEKEIVGYKKELAPVLTVEGYNATGVWLGRKSFINEINSKGFHRFEVYGKQVSVMLEGADELVAIHIAPGVEKWIEETSKYESATTAKEYQRLFEKAQGDYLANNSMTIAELAQAANARAVIASNMFAQGQVMNLARASLMARTMAVWAMNEGAQAQYQDSGVAAVQWLTTLDGATGEWDAALNGQVWATGTNLVNRGDTFTFNRTNAAGEVSTQTITSGIDVQHPPLHPNCRCTLLPVVV